MDAAFELPDLIAEMSKLLTVSDNAVTDESPKQHPEARLDVERLGRQPFVCFSLPINANGVFHRSKTPRFKNVFGVGSHRTH